jgi:hypothetical protein
MRPARRIAANIAKLAQSREIPETTTAFSGPARGILVETGDAGDVTSLGDVRLSVRGLAIGVPDGPAH